MYEKNIKKKGGPLKHGIRINHSMGNTILAKLGRTRTRWLLALLKKLDD